MLEIRISEVFCKVLRSSISLDVSDKSHGSHRSPIAHSQNASGLKFSIYGRSVMPSMLPLAAVPITSQYHSYNLSSKSSN